jgi:hypothetical protein
MNALVSPKPVQSAEYQVSSHSTIPQTEPSPFSTHVTRAYAEPEPPEEALQVVEAPDCGPTVQREAPDAGDGRYDSHDREFTHGRSRG